MSYPREAKLIKYIMRIKINEANNINYMVPYITHFKEENQIGHDNHKRSFLVKRQEAVTNCNIGTSNIMTVNVNDGSFWIIGRISICNEIAQ